MWSSSLLLSEERRDIRPRTFDIMLLNESRAKIGRSVGIHAQTVPSEVSMKDQYHVGAAVSVVHLAGGTTHWNYNVQVASLASEAGSLAMTKKNAALVIPDAMTLSTD